MSTQNPTFAQPAQDSKPAAGAASSMSGKNALLARIQAAKARSQQTAAKPAPTVDLLDLGAPTPAPAATTDNSDLLGGGSSPPPPATVAAPTATDSSATFESLMATTTQPQPQPQPSPVAEVPASSASSAAPEIDEDILAALPPEEREALLEEQRRIMEEIEKKKITTESSGAAARAMAFNQRSSAAVADFAAEGESFQAPAFARPPATPAAAAATATPNGNTVDLGHGEVVPIYGNEETQEAIKDGTALVVQCMNCQSWMQVTGEANLMLCPSCGVVVPVEKSGAATTANMETAAQVAADQQLAEELQKEEYKQAAGQQRQRERRVEGPAPNGKSWMEWIAGTPAPAPGASAPTTSASPRSPGSEERQGLIGSPNRPATAAAGGARVAQQPQSIFACVAGSVAAAAEQMTGISLTEDKEGNVHGVDSSSLLTMP